MSKKPKVAKAVDVPREQPSPNERAYRMDTVRCFYCKSLLLITDDKAGHAVCSNNCPSRLVPINDDEMRLIRKAWRFKAQLDKAKKTAEVS